MKLADWQKQNGVSDAALAGRIGKDRSTVTRYRRGEVLPGVDVINRIVAATDGAVRFEDFVTEPAE